MATIKPLPSLKNQFVWNEELDLAFHKSREIMQLKKELKFLIQIYVPST